MNDPHFLWLWTVWNDALANLIGGLMLLGIDEWRKRRKTKGRKPNP